MIPKECKRLAEVDFPIATVSKHAVREKSIRHGHPSTLHIWWARRPLASCRAMLLALLWPDPCDPLCPEEFKQRARELLPRVQGSIGPADADLRKAILKFIGDFSSWDLSSDDTYLEISRELVKAVYDEEPPLVVDPFAGGGSIPLEALRVGCDAFASDLNPVACLILKAMLEDIPRHGPELAEELRRVGQEIKKQAEKELADFYPADPDGATPIAYLWARTVRCESPNCGAEIPLARSFWLCKKANRKRALRYRILPPSNQAGGPSKPPRVEFEIFEPKSDKDVPNGTVIRARATCPACGAVLPPERVRAQLSEQRGGADVMFDAQGNRIGGARLLAVVTLKSGEQGRHYRLLSEGDYKAVWKAQQRLQQILQEWEQGGRMGVCPVPDEPTPTKDTHRAVGSQIPLYGMTTFGDLFTARQKVALVTLTQLVSKVSDIGGYLIREKMAIVVDRMADGNSALSSWLSSREEVKHVFTRQALPIIWDFAEVYLLSVATRGFDGAIGWVARVVEVWSRKTWGQPNRGQVQLADAVRHPLPDQTATVWFTDPPYYDAVPYADLSDFFFVWLKRALPRHPLLYDPFNPRNILTPKAAEAVLCEKVKDAEGRPKDRAFYEEMMAKAFAEGRRVLRNDGVGSVVFAHKTTEGWEALLSGLIKGGWIITGSWPIATEMGSRLNARETASLATSVHLVCRPRPEDAPVGDWANVLQELPRRVGDWMERLQGEGVRGADLVFACIGPALEIFSRFSRVETAEGREVALAEYLEKVWEVVGRTALEQVLGTAEGRARNGAAGALEEDARLTALFLWTLQSTNSDRINNGDEEIDDNEPSGDDEEEGDEEEEDEEEETTTHTKPKGYALVFDVVRRFAQPLGIDLPKWEGRIIEIRKGVVRLLPVAERARQLFGEHGTQSVDEWLEDVIDSDGKRQLTLFPEFAAAGGPRIRVGSRKQRKINTNVTGETMKTAHKATTLDCVHMAMLLQASGQTNALRVLLKAEQERGPNFLRLANALSALYPKGGEEKRLLDAMLLAVPR